MKDPLTHYIIVRRDLSFAALIANIAHAAGESFYCLGSSEKEHAVFSREGAGSSPASGSTFDPSHTVVVVLGARNEHRLARLVSNLVTGGIAHVAIREPDPPYAGQLMAVGLVPGDKATLAPVLNDFHMLPSPERAD